MCPEPIHPTVHDHDKNILVYNNCNIIIHTFFLFIRTNRDVSLVLQPQRSAVNPWPNVHDNDEVYTSMNEENTYGVSNEENTYEVIPAVMNEPDTATTIENIMYEPMHSSQVIDAAKEGEEKETLSTYTDSD